MGIASSDVFRNQGGSSWKRKSFYPFVGAVSAGAAVGGVIGALAGTFPLEARLAVVSTLAGAILLMGLLELFGKRFRLLAGKRETPQSWLYLGPRRWALRNGAALGLGLASRVGFSLWYVVPLTSFLLGSAFLGAIAFGLYAAARSGTIIGLAALVSRGTFGEYTDRLLSWSGMAHAVSGASSVVVGALLLGQASVWAT